MRNRSVDQVVKDIANGAGGLGFDSRNVQIGHNVTTAGHRCGVSAELCSPGAIEMNPPLVTRFGVIPRV